MNLLGWMGYKGTQEHGFEPVVPRWARGMVPTMSVRDAFKKFGKDEEDEDDDDHLVPVWREDEPKMFKKWAKPPLVKDRRAS